MSLPKRCWVPTSSIASHTSHTPFTASPDGRQVAIASTGHLCVYRVTTGQRRACVDLEESNIVAIDPDSVTWSPDSRLVAFSEGFSAANDASVESDIWLFNPDEREVDDLTADQLVGPIGDLVAAGTSFNADTSPAWSTVPTAV